ncbi:MAG TPA: hypothetical protein VFH44_12330 [Solirubrobacterales bacterium]|nr:hypothetical protein [Solirubrobacterales bacterium]
MPAAIRAIRPARFIPLLVATLAVSVLLAASATAKVPVRFKVIDGFNARGTPAGLDQVGIVKTGRNKAPNVLVLNPGTSAGGGYFNPLARAIVRELPSWQVWSVERRENFLEDQSLVDAVKRGKASGQELFDYYLGYLTDPAVTDHYTPVAEDDVPFARNWGMNVEVQDLHRVVRLAGRRDRNVAMGGHSLGGSIATAYATWDFKGAAGADALSGLVLIDGASRTTPISPEDAESALADLQSGSPWIAFGGIPAPFAGLFGTIGSALAKAEPDDPSIFRGWPLLPANLRPPVAATNKASFGYATDVATSPPSLAAAQVHAGRLADAGDPRGWNRDGAITPLNRWASMFSGWQLTGLDGTAWYHPSRLSIDSSAVGNGIANPAQEVLNVHATHGEDLPRRLRIYAFGAALGGDRVPAAAEALAEQSGIPDSHLTLADRGATYAHNDPNSAAPKVNHFLKKLIPFLHGIRQR